MAALPDLITVAQFRAMPEDEAYSYELHCGEVVAVTRPKCWHLDRQHKLRDLLTPKLLNFKLLIELGFRALPEFDLRVADVGAVLSDRWSVARREGDLFGAPELVVEIKSPSNRPRELQERASMCLTHGSLEFWIVDEEPRTVAVFHQDGSKAVYRPGDSIPLAAFGSDSVSVDDTFA